MSYSTANIGGNKEDAFYRYKMPKPQVKHEGSGNGVKTVWSNFNAIVTSLKSSSSYIAKFYSIELGTQTKVSKEELTLNGTHAVSIIESILGKYIKLLLLCSKCSLPETNLVLDSKGRLGSSCSACGACILISSSHKIISFITSKLKPSKDVVFSDVKNKVTSNESKTEEKVPLDTVIKDLIKQEKCTLEELKLYQLIYEVDKKTIIQMLITNDVSPLSPIISSLIDKEHSLMISLISSIAAHVKLTQLNKTILYLYDKEVVTEKSILEWFYSLGKDETTVKTKAQTIVDWLNSAEEE